MLHDLGLVLECMIKYELNIIETPLKLWKEVANVSMRFESVMDIVRIIVGIVVDNVAELNSRIVVDMN